MPQPEPLQPWRAQKQRPYRTEDIRDACRRPTSHPAGVRAAYYELNGLITVHLDSFVEQRVKATNDFKDLLTPLLDQMQSMLSKRGKLRKLLDLAGAPQWGEWLQRISRSACISTSPFARSPKMIKTRKYRETENPPPDVNVTAERIHPPS